MKKLITILATVLALGVNAQITTTVYLDPYKKQFKQEQYTVNNNGLLTGNYIIYYQADGSLNKPHFIFKFNSGNLFEETEYAKNGTIIYSKSMTTGKFILYYDNGKKYFDASFNPKALNYLPQSTDFMFPHSNMKASSTIDFPLKKLIFESLWRDGLFPYTKIVYYYPNGKIETDNTFDLQTFESKKLIEFDESGKKTFERIRREDNVYEANFYDADFNTKYLSIERIINDKRELVNNGIAQYYDSTGINPTGYRKYINGKNNGKAKVYYDENWEEISNKNRAFYYREIEYRNDTIIGIVKDYYITGELQGESYLISEDPDKFKGEVRLYYKSGNLEYIGVYDDKSFYLNGKSFNENNTLSQEIKFLKDKYANSYDANRFKDVYKMINYDSLGVFVEEGEFYYNNDNATKESNPIIKIGNWRNASNKNAFDLYLKKIDDFISERNFNKADLLIDSLILTDKSSEILIQKKEILTSVKEEIETNKADANKLYLHLKNKYGYLAIVSSPKTKEFNEFVTKTDTVAVLLYNTQIISEKLELSREFLSLCKDFEKKFNN